MDENILDRRAAIDLLAAWAQDSEVEYEEAGRDHWVVTLPGERKLKTTVSVRFSGRGVNLEAFVIRHPDENEAQFHSWLLRRNGSLQSCAFFIDKLGDVYLGAHVPAAAWNAEWVDALMGQLLMAADDSFNELLVIGFLTSMKREWAWRVARGESTMNLKAFEPLLSGPDNEFIGTFDH